MQINCSIPTTHKKQYDISLSGINSLPIKKGLSTIQLIITHISFEHNAMKEYICAEELFI
jgi:hypothetical protein